MRIILAAMMMSAGTAAAAAPLGFPCRSAPITDAVRTREATAIAAATHRPMAPRRIDYLLRSGDWKMVWITPPQEARNVFLFRQTNKGWKLIDTWHGDLGTDDPQAGLDWAAKRHVPTDLTDCFGTVLINHP